MSSELKIVIHSGRYPSYLAQPTGSLSGWVEDAARRKWTGNIKGEAESQGRIGSLQLKKLPGRTSSIAQMFLKPTIVILVMEVPLFKSCQRRINIYTTTAN